MSSSPTRLSPLSRWSLRTGHLPQRPGAMFAHRAAVSGRVVSPSQKEESMLRKSFGFSAVALAIGVASLLPARSASAQQYLEAGTWELTLTGAGSSNQDADAGNAALQGSLGYFVIDQLELLVRQSVGYVDNDNLTGGGTSVTASTAVAIDYHFDLDRWQPFIGAGI